MINLTESFGSNIIIIIVFIIYLFFIFYFILFFDYYVWIVSSHI